MTAVHRHNVNGAFRQQAHGNASPIVRDDAIQVVWHVRAGIESGNLPPTPLGWIEKCNRHLFSVFCELRHSAEIGRGPGTTDRAKRTGRKHDLCRPSSVGNSNKLFRWRWIARLRRQKPQNPPSVRADSRKAKISGPAKYELGSVLVQSLPVN